ncbi:hypothetical protein SNEBB_006208 [Seison nebaliae]|nr:hypothetical protein SNEBB_006208 [Seison nebaliae]
MGNHSNRFQYEPIEKYFDEKLLSNYKFSYALGTTRLSKSAVAIDETTNCLCVVKVYPFINLTLDENQRNLMKNNGANGKKELNEQISLESNDTNRNQKDISINRLMNNEVNNFDYQMRQLSELSIEQTSNCLSFYNIFYIASHNWAITIRPFVKMNLYERIHSIIPLIDIEKRWITFQLLESLKQIHSMNIVHGDIKMENILLTSTSWLFLSDFATFKPSSVSDGDFIFYFDSSWRTTCCLAPERVCCNEENSRLMKKSWTMDIFSAGCVLLELFSNNHHPPFTMALLLAYKKGEYDIEQRLLMVENVEIRNLCRDMVQIQPNKRLSAKDLLNKYKGRIFPKNFSTVLHPLIQVSSMNGTNSFPPDMLIELFSLQLTKEKLRLMTNEIFGNLIIFNVILEYCRKVRSNETQIQSMKLLELIIEDIYERIRLNKNELLLNELIEEKSNDKYWKNYLIFSQIIVDRFIPILIGNFIMPQTFSNNFNIQSFYQYDDIMMHSADIRLAPQSLSIVCQSFMLIDKLLTNFIIVNPSYDNIYLYVSYLLPQLKNVFDIIRYSTLSINSSSSSTTSNTAISATSVNDESNKLNETPINDLPLSSFIQTTPTTTSVLMISNSNYMKYLLAKYINRFILIATDYHKNIQKVFMEIKESYENNKNDNIILNESVKWAKEISDWTSENDTQSTLLENELDENEMNLKENENDVSTVKLLFVDVNKSLMKFLDLFVELFLTDNDKSIRLVFLQYIGSLLKKNCQSDQLGDKILKHTLTFFNNNPNWQLRHQFYETLTNIVIYLPMNEIVNFKTFLEEGIFDNEETVRVACLKMLRKLISLNVFCVKKLEFFIDYLQSNLTYPNKEIIHLTLAVYRQILFPHWHGGMTKEMAIKSINLSAIERIITIFKSYFRKSSFELEWNEKIDDIDTESIEYQRYVRRERIHQLELERNEKCFHINNLVVKLFDIERAMDDLVEQFPLTFIRDVLSLSPTIIQQYIQYVYLKYREQNDEKFIKNSVSENKIITSLYRFIYSDRIPLHSMNHVTNSQSSTNIRNKSSRNSSGPFTSISASSISSRVTKSAHLLIGNDELLNVVNQIERLLRNVKYEQEHLVNILRYLMECAKRIQHRNIRLTENCHRMELPKSGGINNWPLRKTKNGITLFLFNSRYPDNFENINVNYMKEEFSQFFQDYMRRPFVNSYHLFTSNDLDIITAKRLADYCFQTTEFEKKFLKQYPVESKDIKSIHDTGDDDDVVDEKNDKKSKRNSKKLNLVKVNNDLKEFFLQLKHLYRTILKNNGNHQFIPSLFSDRLYALFLNDNDNLNNVSTFYEYIVLLSCLKQRNCVEFSSGQRPMTPWYLEKLTNNETELYNLSESITTLFTLNDDDYIISYNDLISGILHPILSHENFIRLTKLKRQNNRNLKKIDINEISMISQENPALSKSNRFSVDNNQTVGFSNWFMTPLQPTDNVDIKKEHRRNLTGMDINRNLLINNQNSSSQQTLAMTEKKTFSFEQMRTIYFFYLLYLFNLNSSMKHIFYIYIAHNEQYRKYLNDLSQINDWDVAIQQIHNKIPFSSFPAAQLSSTNSLLVSSMKPHLKNRAAELTIQLILSYMEVRNNYSGRLSHSSKLGHLFYYYFYTDIISVELLGTAAKSWTATEEMGERAHLLTHTDSITNINTSRDAQATIDRYDEHIRSSIYYQDIWKPEGELILHLNEHQSSITALQLHRATGNSFMLSTDAGGHLKLWDMRQMNTLIGEESKIVQSIHQKQFDSNIVSARFCHGNPYIISLITTNNQLIITDLNCDKEIIYSTKSNKSSNSYYPTILDGFFQTHLRKQCISDPNQRMNLLLKKCIFNLSTFHCEKDSISALNRCEINQHKFFNLTDMDGHPTCLEWFDSTNYETIGLMDIPSTSQIRGGLGSYTLMYGTSCGNIVGVDCRMRNPTHLYRTPVSNGALTHLTVDACQSRWVASGTNKGIVTIWDMRCGVPLKVYETPNSSEITALHSMYRGSISNTLAVAYQGQNSLDLFCLDSSHDIPSWSFKVPDCQDSYIKSICSDLTGEWILCGGSDSRIRYLNMEQVDKSFICVPNKFDLIDRHRNHRIYKIQENDTKQSISEMNVPLNNETTRKFFNSLDDNNNNNNNNSNTMDSINNSMNGGHCSVISNGNVHHENIMTHCQVFTSSELSHFVSSDVEGIIKIWR